MKRVMRLLVDVSTMTDSVVPARNSALHGIPVTLAQVLGLAALRPHRDGEGSVGLGKGSVGPEGGKPKHLSKRNRNAMQCRVARRQESASRHNAVSHLRDVDEETHHALHQEPTEEVRRDSPMGDNPKP